MLAQEKPAVD
uniref:Uncharacterized protein n=1 Tax=Arundo donax TaxID=35708 RepID=A0A0A9HPA5_ARUDO